MGDYSSLRESRSRLKMNVRASLALAGLILMSGPLVLTQVVILRFWPARGQRIPVWWHRIASRLLGIQIRTHGRQITNRPVLFVSNHISWLDIVTLGATIKASFISKSEVANWGIFAFCARMHRTVYIDRTRRSQSHNQRTALEERFTEGNSVILFPEGTSTDGTIVKPFKSALFSAAERPLDGGKYDAKNGVPHYITVQPVTLSYVRVNGMPVGRAMRPKLAWYGDMELTDHVWEIMGMGRIDALVQFHEPVTIDAFGSRKAMAKACHESVSQGLMQAHRDGAGLVAPSGSEARPS